MFGQILITLDGSKYSERALEYTRDLAKLTGASVRLFSAILPAGPGLPSESAPAERDDSIGKVWLAYLEEKATIVRDAGVEVTASIGYGDPARLIVQTARDVGADLIVMSTHGRGATEDHLVGSVALKVLSIAPCPIFMVRINRPEPPRTVSEERWQGEGGRNTG